MLKQGQLTISRGSDGMIRIRLKDKSSHTECVEIRCAPADFANAVTGLAYQSCTFDWCPEYVGKLREHKEVIVPVPAGALAWGKTLEEKCAILEPFEIDGWRGRLEDLGNHHRRTQDGYRVSFVRYIEE